MGIGASEHRTLVRAKARFAGQKAQEHSFVRRNAVTPDMLPCIVAGIFWRKVPRVPCPSRRPSVRPARSHSIPVAPARPSAAFTSARCEPFPVFPLLPGPSTCPAWPSAASVSARCEPVPAFPLLPGPSTCPAWLSAASVSARCEPILAFPLLPGPSTCPARPSAASVAARCEPILAFPLLPGPSTCPAWPSATPTSARCDSGIPARHYGSGRPGTGCLLRCFCVEQEAARSRCAAQQNIYGRPYR